MVTDSSIMKMSTSTPSKSSSTDQDDFIAVFDELANHVVDDLVNYEMPKEAIDWIRDNLHYNVPGGKMNRGLSVLSSYEIIRGGILSKEERRDALILGWCVEWLQAFFLVADDIMDHSVTRRGQPCWYKRPNVGLVAINDSFILEAAIYKILFWHFGERPFYLKLVELFREVTYKTELGQLLDLITAPPDDVDLNRFSMDKYKKIVKYKTAFYSFSLPVHMAMMLAEIDDVKAYDDAERILLIMGEFFQIQDDYLDCYGDPKYIGKIGTDIEDNKCGWLINQALLRTSPEQRAILDANYGKADPKCAEQVKIVFNELQMPRLFEEFEEKSYRDLMNYIDLFSTCRVPKAVFTAFASKIYKRTK